MTESVWIHVGANGSAVGVLNIDGGSITSPGMSVGYSGNAQGTVNQSGGLINLTSNSLYLAEQPGNSATYNLSGGTLRTTQVTNGGGTGNFYFNGGTLQASGSNSNYFTATNSYIQSGAVIDTNGYDITMANDFGPDPASSARTAA